MRIAAIEHALPSKRITNELLLREVRRLNEGHLTPERLEAVESAIRRTLAGAGTEVRYHLDEHERPIDLAMQAGQRALAAAGIAPEDVDFLIYAGVARGWLEPATAPAVQTALGLRNATAFDVLDACAGWLRALHIAHSFIRGGTYRRGLIVNCECGLSRADVNWKFDENERLEDRITASTIGEAATATIVDDEQPADDFYFTFRTAGEHYPLCVIPLPGAEGFAPGQADEQWMPGRFHSRSRRLIEAVTTGIVELFRDEPVLHGRYDIAFGHEVSVAVCEAVTRHLGVADVYFPTHHLYGNTVSASVPLGMSTALREERLERGDRVLVIVGASGITVGLAAFTF